MQIENDNASFTSPACIPELADSAVGVAALCSGDMPADTVPAKPPKRNRRQRKSKNVNDATANDKGSHDTSTFMQQTVDELPCNRPSVTDERMLGILLALNDWSEAGCSLYNRYCADVAERNQVSVPDCLAGASDFDSASVIRLMKSSIESVQALNDWSEPGVCRLFKSYSATVASYNDTLQDIAAFAVSKQDDNGSSSHSGNGSCSHALQG